MCYVYFDDLDLPDNDFIFRIFVTYELRSLSQTNGLNDLLFIRGLHKLLRAVVVISFPTFYSQSHYEVFNSSMNHGVLLSLLRAVLKPNIS